MASGPLGPNGPELTKMASLAGVNFAAAKWSKIQLPSRPGTTDMLSDRPSKTIWLAAIAAVCIVSGAAAQSENPAEAETPPVIAEQPADAAADESVEEITVYGVKTVQAINIQIMSADRKLYGIWNEMNTDRQFDVHCRLEGVYASRRKERICLPAFEHGVLEESWDDLSSYTGAGRPQAEIRKNREIMKQKMIEYAAQNPALHAAILERANLQRDLAEAEARGKNGNDE